MVQAEHRSAAIGKAMADGTGPISTVAAAGSSLACGSVSALVEAMMAVVTIMPVMRVMMMAHPGIGVEHARLHLRGLGNRRMRGLGGGAGGKRRRDENGSCEQRSGNGLQHGGLLLQLKPRGVPVGWPGPSILLATLSATR